MYRYVSDRSDDAVRRAALTAYENARDTYNQCVLRVNTRRDLRTVFTGIYDAIDQEAKTQQGHDFVAHLRATLDEKYPQLSLSDCPPQPAAPGG